MFFAATRTVRRLLKRMNRLSNVKCAVFNTALSAILFSRGIQFKKRIRKPKTRRLYRQRIFKKYHLRILTIRKWRVQAQLKLTLSK